MPTHVFEPSELAAFPLGGHQQETISSTLFSTATPEQQHTKIIALTRRAATKMQAACPSVIPSSYAGWAETENLIWVSRFGLLDGPSAAEKVRRTRCGYLSALAYPNGSPDLVLLGANFFSWLFLFDDLYGEGGDNNKGEALKDLGPSLVAVLQTGQCLHNEPFHLSLLDIHRRALKCGPEWLTRIAMDLKIYFEGCRLELPYRKASSAASLAQYFKIRLFSSAMFSVLDLVELDLPHSLSEASIKRPEISELRMLASLAVCWDNDIISYAKEQDCGAPLNLVTVIQQEYQITIDEAFKTAADFFLETLNRFINLQNRLVVDRKLSQNEERYIKGLLNWVYGNRAWGAFTLRYQTI
jgi:hypothetical protein